MLIAAVVLSLIIVCLLVLFLRYRGIRLAYLWLILIVVVSLVWALAYIVLPGYGLPLVLQNWFGYSSSAINLKLTVDGSNWHISFIYFSILLSFLLTSIVHLEGNKSLFSWLETIILIVIGWISILARDYWSILISWTLIDFMDIFYYFRYKSLNTEKLLTHFLLKFIGSMLLVYAISTSFQVNPQQLFEKSFKGMGVIVLLAAIFHSGLLSDSFISRTGNKETLNFHTIIIRSTCFVSSFYVLSFIQNPGLAIIQGIFLKFLFIAIAIIGAFRWVKGYDEYHRSSSLLYAFGGIVGFTYLSGGNAEIAYWLMALLVSIAAMFLSTIRPKGGTYIWIPATIMLSGLPFSITKNVLTRMQSSGNWLDIVLTALPLILIISGFIKHGNSKKEVTHDLDPWYLAIYQIGLFLPLVSWIGITIKNFESITHELIGWWIGAGIAGLSISFHLFTLRSKSKVSPHWDSERNSPPLSKIFLLLRNSLHVSLNVLRSILRFVLNLFEGVGGVLWSIVFLALFLTILRFQGEF